MYFNSMSVISLTRVAFISSTLLLSSSSVASFQVGTESKKFKKAVEPLAPREITLPIIQPGSRSRESNDELPALIIEDDNRFQTKIPSCPPLKAIVSVDHQDGKEKESFFPAALPLSASITTQDEIPATRKLQHRRIWGIDEDPAEYWFNNRIHSFGNVGVFGMFHAVMAPVATTIIDKFAYNGQDVRTMISAYLNDLICKKNARVLDLCCGVGISTRALHGAFFDAELVLGLDTSQEMLSMARLFRKRDETMNKIRSFFVNLMERKEDKDTEDLQKINFARGNAERTIFPQKSFDLVTIMYGFHEIPKLGRYRILREARRLLQKGGTLCIVDIVPEYQPSPSMLAGEPYVLEYQKNIMNQLKRVQGFIDFEYQTVVKGHVGMWLLTRK